VNDKELSLADDEENFRSNSFERDLIDDLRSLREEDVFEFIDWEVVVVVVGGPDMICKDERRLVMLGRKLCRLVEVESDIRVVVPVPVVSIAVDDRYGWRVVVRYMIASKPEVKNSE
jgi:hypothetical protein